MSTLQYWLLARREAREALRDVNESHQEFRGAWVSYPGGRRYLVARAGGYNHRFPTALAAALEPYKMALAADALTDETADRILARTYARAVVLDWEGEDLPEHSEEAAEAHLLDDRDAFADLRAIAEDPENYREQPRTYG